jgi:hypothetical protein
LRFLLILTVITFSGAYGGDVFLTPSSDIEVETGETLDVALNDGLVGEIFLRPANAEANSIITVSGFMTNECTLDTSGLGAGKYYLVVELDGKTNAGPTITVNEPGSGVAFSLPKMYVQPNPFDLSTHSGTLAFVNTPSGSIIKIYDMAGKVVSELAAGETEWDGRNGRGDLVASGTYMFYVTGGGLEFTGKFAVIK